MGLLEEYKKLENQERELYKRFRFCVTDGSSQVEAAYVSTSDGVLRILSDKIETKEECIAICEWYLNLAKEL